MLSPFFTIVSVHDCKRYVENYHELHYRHGLEKAVSILFGLIHQLTGQQGRIYK